MIPTLVFQVSSEHQQSFRVQNQSSRRWIDLNDSDTSEQNNSSLMQVCNNIFDREDKAQAANGKLVIKIMPLR